MANKDITPLVDASGRPLPRRNGKRRRFPVTKKQGLAAIAFVGIAGALSVNLSNTTSFACSNIERLIGVPFAKPVVLSEKHVRDPKDEFRHVLSFFLTNPTDRYALLENVTLEVTQYEDTGVYTLPDTRVWERFEENFSESTSGPVETHFAGVTLGPSEKSYLVFETGINFPKSETRHFEISIRAVAGGRYSYHASQKWSVPELDAELITVTDDYTIESPLLRSSLETEAWLSTAKVGVLVFVPTEDVESMFDRDAGVVRQFFIPKDVKVPGFMESLQMPVHGLLVPLPPLAHNVAALSTLNKVPENVSVTVLTSLPGNSRLTRRKIYVIDQESALVEIVQDEHEDRVGEILWEKKQVEVLLKDLGLVDHERCTEFLLDFSGDGWVAWEFTQSGDAVVLQEICER